MITDFLGFRKLNFDWSVVIGLSGQ